MDNNYQFWGEFIELYREQVCLWDVKSNDYSNKHKRNASYEIMLKKMQEISTKATMEVVKKKINNMRTAFRRELKKVQSSRSTGAGGDSYEPSLWYYDLLLFTAQSESGRKGISTLEDNLENDMVDTLDEADDNEEERSETPLTQFSAISESQSEGHVFINQSENTTATPQSSRSSYHNSCHQQKTSKRKKNNTIEQKREEVLQLAHNALLNCNNNEDKYDIAGKRIGYQLKRLQEHQRIIAEKMIAEVIFYAKMNKLTEESSIQLSSYVPQSRSMGNCNLYPMYATCTAG